MGMMHLGMALRFKENLQKKSNKKSVKCVEFLKNGVGYRI